MAIALELGVSLQGKYHLMSQLAAVSRCEKNVVKKLALLEIPNACRAGSTMQQGSPQPQQTHQSCAYNCVRVLLHLM